MIFAAVVLRLLVVLFGRHIRWTSGQVDVDAAGILLGRILQTKVATDLLNAWLELLDVVHGVVAFADDAIYDETRVYQHSINNAMHE